MIFAINPRYFAFFLKMRWMVVRLTGRLGRKKYGIPRAM